ILVLLGGHASFPCSDIWTVASLSSRTSCGLFVCWTNPTDLPTLQKEVGMHTHSCRVYGPTTYGWQRRWRTRFPSAVRSSTTISAVTPSGRGTGLAPG